MDDLADRTEYLLREFAYTRTRRRSRGWLGRLLLVPARFVGVDPRLLQECGRKQRRSTFVLAMSVFLTVSLAAIYGYTAAGLYAFGEVRFTRLAIASGIVLASFVYIVERVLLEMLSREFKFARTVEEIERYGVGDRSSSLRSFFKLVFAFITRFTVAMLIATIVSEPLLLLIYEDDVDRILQTRRDQEFKAKKSALDEQWKPRLAAEARRQGIDRTGLDQAEAALDAFEAYQAGLPALIQELEVDVLNRQTLADCELKGVPYRTDNARGDPRSETCSVALDALNAKIADGQPLLRLSGFDTCDELCNGHIQAAIDLAKVLSLRKTELENEEDERLRLTNLVTEAQEALEKQTADDLEVPLSPGSDFMAPSAEAARLLCETTKLAIEYKQTGLNKQETDALFAGEYCPQGRPSADAFVPYSGLQTRQDAFTVISQCADPYALRSTTLQENQPAQCYLTAGLEVPAGLDPSWQSRDSYWDRFSGTLTDTFNVPDSTLGRSAARLRWLILLLDTLPIFLKFSQSLRKYRAYDALESFEHQAFHIALANGISDLNGDTPEEKRRRADMLRKLLATRRQHLARLFARPARGDRRRFRKGPDDGQGGGASAANVIQPDLNPDPMGTTVIVKDDGEDTAEAAEAGEASEPDAKSEDEER